MTHASKMLTALTFTSVVSLLGVMQGESHAAVTACRGGAQEAVSGSTNNAPVVNAGGLAVLPFSIVSGGASGAVGDSDLYVVTWSGQSINTVGAWTAQAQVSINGGAFVSIDPVGPNIMHTGATPETNTMTWCRRLAATGSTSFRIVWAKIGGGAVTVDNYLTMVERSD
jgi:hypothetical protein